MYRYSVNPTPNVRGKIEVEKYVDFGWADPASYENPVAIIECDSIEEARLYETGEAHHG